MSGDQLNFAIQSLQSAIDELDSTVRAVSQNAKSAQAASDQAEAEMAGLSAKTLRQELSALKQMITTATTLIDQNQTETTAPSAQKVSH